MGTPEFAVPSLTALLDEGCPVVAVVTAPDKPRGRGRKTTPTPVKETAARRGLPILQPPSLRDDVFRETLRGFRPDLIVVVAFRILPRSVFALPRLGSVNLHASLLPRYRGAAPIHWAIINGETETGVTTFLLQEQVDTGGVLLQERVPILQDDDAGSLHDRLAVVGAQLLVRTVRLLDEGTGVPRTQDDSLASPAPKIFREDCLVDWNRPVTAIRNRIRGLSPHPAAFTTHEGRVLKLYRSEIAGQGEREAPGRVIVHGDSLMVAGADGLLSVTELQAEGRKRMGAAEFLRGYPLRSGERFGEP